MPTPPSTASSSSPFLIVSGKTRAMMDGATMRCVQTTGLPFGSSPACSRWWLTPVLRVPDIVLAGPDHLDRGRGGLGSFERLLDEIQFEAPAEPAPQIGRVDEDLVGGYAADLGAQPLRAGLKLGRRPDVHAVGADVGGG